MEVTKEVKDVLLTLAKKKRIYLEGNILKVLKAEEGDIEFQKYLDACKEKDTTARKKRLTVTKQVQNQNKELVAKQEENDTLMEELQTALEEAKNAEWEAEKLRDEAEKGKEQALEDLDLMQKRSQFELIGTIVRVALVIIIGVGIVTTIMYGIAMMSGQDTQIIGSTWSNMFGILLTNAFSIVGTIMGVKYASEKE
jgi:Fe2+ transport system protein B